jgi:transposase
MLSLSLPGRVFLCTLPTDMRKSFDSLAGLVQQHLDQDPLSGDLFVFRSKRGDRVKLLYWDQDGLAIWYKRLEEGTFVLPAANDKRARVGEHGLVLRPAELAMLLDGIDLASVKRQRRYQRPSPAPIPAGAACQ